MAQTQTISAVQEAVVGALGVSEDEAAPDATLMDDLGAESIDLLDILFRIERSTGVKIQASDLAEYIQGVGSRGSSVFARSNSRWAFGSFPLLLNALPR